MRFGAVFQNRKAYGAVRAVFPIIVNPTVRFGFFATNTTVRFGAVFKNRKSSGRCGSVRFSENRKSYGAVRFGDISYTVRFGSVPR